ncbi:Protein R08D7.1 [Aphelenchoides avenae]|nr:Protein R08D7.1 [Aphelenchus avenae]
MSTAAASSRAEYLKKYLSGGDDGTKKKKKKKTKDTGRGMRVMEDDAFLSVAPGAVRTVASDEESDEERATKSPLALTNRQLVNGMILETKVHLVLADDTTVAQTTALQDDEHVTIVMTQARRDLGNGTIVTRIAVLHADEPDMTVTRAHLVRAGDMTAVTTGVRRVEGSAMTVMTTVVHLVTGNVTIRTPIRALREDACDKILGMQARLDAVDHMQQNETQAHREGARLAIVTTISRRLGVAAGMTRAIGVVRDEDEQAIDPNDKNRKTLDGKKAGLVSSKEMKDEAKRLKEADKKLFENVDETLLGKDAETVRRATSLYKKKKKDTKEDEERKEREAAKQKELAEKYKTWNKGVAQLNERKEQLEEMERVVNEPFTRYADNEAMNEHLKEQLHVGEDPMADYMSKKKHKVEMKTGVVYPTFKGPWPPNRFGIPPGYRWDGVDRSNGFEGRLSLADNKRRANDEIAYRTIAELAE